MKTEKEIFKYALKKLENDLKMELTPYKLFREKSNYNYRITFYEMSNEKLWEKDTKSFIPFDKYCKNFLKTGENKIKDIKESIDFIKSKLKGV